MESIEPPIRKLFTFNFYPSYESNDPEYDRRGFVIIFNSNYDYGKFSSWIETDDWYEHLSDMEYDYGMHKFCTHGHKEIVSYYAYSINMSMRDEVMTIWRDYFIENGYECGEIIRELTPDDYDYKDLNLDNSDSYNVGNAWYEAHNGV